MKQRMSKARFIQEYVLDRRGRFEDNVKQAEKAYLHLSEQGYGDDEFMTIPTRTITDEFGNSYTLNESATGGSDD